MSLSYKNQSIDLQWKSTDWFACITLTADKTTAALACDSLGVTLSHILWTEINLTLYFTMSENGQTHFKTLHSKGLSNYNFKFETGE